MTDNTTSLALNGFKQAVENVHYIAKVHMLKVKTINEDAETDKHVYSAKVLVTYKGKSQQAISYEMLVEKGEDAVVESTPVYIALCVSHQGTYYWPGTGALFLPSEAIKLWLLNNKESVRTMPTTEGWCN